MPFEETSRLEEMAFRKSAGQGRNLTAQVPSEDAGSRAVVQRPFDEMLLNTTKSGENAVRGGSRGETLLVGDVKMRSRAKCSCER